MQKYINFDKMITPTIIKILFWIGVGISAITAIIIFISGLGLIFSPYESAFFGLLLLLFSFITFVVGSLFARIYCELLIVLFKMQESLISIDERLDDR